MVVETKYNIHPACNTSQKKFCCFFRGKKIVIFEVYCDTMGYVILITGLHLTANSIQRVDIHAVIYGNCAYSGKLEKIPGVISKVLLSLFSGFSCLGATREATGTLLPFGPPGPLREFRSNRSRPVYGKVGGTAQKTAQRTPITGAQPQFHHCGLCTIPHWTSTNLLIE